MFKLLGVIAGVPRKKHFTWCAGLAFVAFLLSASACAQNALKAADQPAISDAAQIRATADKLINSGVPDDVIRGASLLEKADQLEQAQLNVERLALEKEKLRLDLAASQGSHWKDTLVTFIPLATTVILAGTLIFQIQQARVERWQRRVDAAEDAKQKKIERDDRREAAAVEAEQKKEQRFMDALRDLQTSDNATAVALINTFREEPYRRRALVVTVNRLLAQKTMAEFEALYMDVVNPLTYNDLPQIVRLCKEVDSSYFSIATAVWNEKTRQNEVEKLSPEDRARLDLYLSEQGFLSQKLAALLHTPAPAGVPVDLSNLVLRDVKLSGVNLGAANISGASWNYVNTDDSDMSRIVEFDGCRMRLTAWWHASRVSRPLLEHLKKNFPFSLGSEYSTERPLSADDYAACVAKLEAGGSETGGSRAPGAASARNG
ncbi:MAG: flagellar export protein FliJ [Candidatus Sulfotelmatobacter sp.]|jgi:hypothetical protein